MVKPHQAAHEPSVCSAEAEANKLRAACLAGTEAYRQALIRAGHLPKVKRR